MIITPPLYPKLFEKSHREIPQRLRQFSKEKARLVHLINRYCKNPKSKYPEAQMASSFLKTKWIKIPHIGSIMGRIPMLAPGSNESTPNGESVVHTIAAPLSQLNIEVNDINVGK